MGKELVELLNKILTKANDIASKLDSIDKTQDVQIDEHIVNPIRSVGLLFYNLFITSGELY